MGMAKHHDVACPPSPARDRCAVWALAPRFRARIAEIFIPEFAPRAPRSAVFDRLGRSRKDAPWSSRCFRLVSMVDRCGVPRDHQPRYPDVVNTCYPRPTYFVSPCWFDSAPAWALRRNPIHPAAVLYPLIMSLWRAFERGVILAARALASRRFSGSSIFNPLPVTFGRHFSLQYWYKGALTTWRHWVRLARFRGTGFLLVTSSKLSPSRRPVPRIAAAQTHRGRK